MKTKQKQPHRPIDIGTNKDGQTSQEKIKKIDELMN